MSNIWGSNLADMLLRNRCSKKVCYYCEILMFLPNMLGLFLLKKRLMKLLMRRLLKNLKVFFKYSFRKANKIWFEEGSEVVVIKKMILKFLQQIMKENQWLLNDSLESSRVRLKRI